MKPSSVVKAPQYESPKIIGPRYVKIKANLGEWLFLCCEAIANSKDTTLIYWLVNGSFPEDLISSERILESNESSLDNGAILQRSLFLKNVTSEDFQSSFTCVVTNPAGTTIKKFRLAARGKSIKHSMSPQQKVEGS